MTDSVLRRSQLVTPALNPRMIQKAAALECDSLVLDLEDAVAPSQKAEARTVLRQALTGMSFQGKEVGVRINALDSRWFLDDLLAIEGLPIDTLVVPKVQDAAQVLAYDALLGQLEARGGKPGITLQLLIESARGLEHAAAIARASPRCVSLIFGAGDFAADTGVAFTRLGLLYGRMLVAAAAAAAGVQALDHVHPDIADDAGLSTEASEGREIGFTGKWAIHPRQLPIIHQAFTPTPSEIQEAGRIIQAYEASLGRGQGAISLDGALIDEAIMKIMRRRRALAERAGVWTQQTLRHEGDIN